ncbi:hypothetical protein J7643_05915 [bacterium]|nr:hypothetical protein [bacterium]
MTKKLLALLPLLLAGCGLSGTGALLSDKAPATLKAKQISDFQALYPLEAGTEWRYRTIQRNGDSAERPGQEQRMIVTESKTEQGVTTAVVERYYGDRQSPTTLAVRSAQGVVLSRYGQPELGSLTVMKFPLTSGAKWGGRIKTNVTETVAYEGTASVTVPAGTFAAERLTHYLTYPNGHVDRLDYWYVAGIGMVKAVEGLTIDLGQGPKLNQVTAELSSFTPAASRKN